MEKLIGAKIRSEASHGRVVFPFGSVSFLPFFATYDQDGEAKGKGKETPKEGTWTTRLKKKDDSSFGRVHILVPHGHMESSFSFPSSFLGALLCLWGPFPLLAFGLRRHDQIWTSQSGWERVAPKEIGKACRRYAQGKVATPPNPPEKKKKPSSVYLRFSFFWRCSLLSRFSSWLL